jgi:hypothetical protein
VIELSRIANGLTDEVDGVVFLGSVEEGHIGRSVTGALDADGDGVADILVGGNDQAWLVPGDGPKTASGTSTLDDKPKPIMNLSRQMPGASAVEEFGATVFRPGSDGVLGDLTVGPAGNANADESNEGPDDFVIGAPGADPAGRTNAGKAYIVYGRSLGFGEEVLLSEVGVTEAGLVVAGAEGANGLEPGDALGSAVGGGYDVTGDFVADVLVGAPFADVGAATDAGQAYVISPVSPDEVLQVSVDLSRVEWTVPHRALAFNAYRGLLSTLRSAQQVRTSDMTQLSCGTFTDTDLDGLPDKTDPTLPPAKNGFFYLATAHNLMGEGPLGAGSESAPPRLNDAQCP